VSEAALMPGDLHNADEVFITSTTRELLPVLDNRAQSASAG